MRSPWHLRAVTGRPGLASPASCGSAPATDLNEPVPRSGAQSRGVVQPYSVATWEAGLDSSGDNKRTAPGHARRRNDSSSRHHAKVALTDDS